MQELPLALLQRAQNSIVWNVSALFESSPTFRRALLIFFWLRAFLHSSVLIEGNRIQVTLFSR